MNTLTASALRPAASHSHSHAATDLPAPAQAVLRLLQGLRHGVLTLYAPDGHAMVFGQADTPDASPPPLQAQLHVHHWRVCAAALRSGDIGFAQSYIAGDWSSPNLSALLQLLLANRAALDEVIHGSWGGRLLYRLRHLLHRNTRSNSRDNIHAHYDLGNAFYRLWLDDSMNYSSGLFTDRQTQSLPDAQYAKVARALQQAGVQPGHRVLEIGCGWGALAEQAIRDCGAHVTGVTLSTEQLGFAQQRLRLADLGHNADLRLQDYRDINDAPFDAICSIEMIEAVGRSFWPTYFAQVARLLKPGGRACIQSIVIQDRLFERYINSTDFIQQYIFPGGCLPCPSAFKRQAQAAHLQVVDEFSFGRDYAETCRRWRTAFMNQRDAVLALGFDERFLRTWDFYLAYCEAGFESGDIDVVQYTLQR